MPRVPAYNQPQVQQSALAVPQQSANAPSDAFGAAVATGLGNLAQEMQRAQDEADALRVKEATNKAHEQVIDLTFNRDTGFVNQKGLAALERQSKQSLPDEVTASFSKAAAEIESSLGNDRQKQLFRQQVGSMSLQLRESSSRHVNDEYKTYHLSVNEGTIKNRTNQIGLFYNDPGKIDAAVADINQAAYDIGRMQGKSAEEITANQRLLTSNAHSVAIGSALEHNNIAYAEDYLKKYAKQMDADDLLKVRGKITKEMDAKVAIAAANTVLREAAPALQPNDITRVWTLLKGQESGNRHFDKSGQVVTSVKGATGIAQVMPATGPEAAKIAGLPWDQKRFRDDPAYNEALGRAYFTHQLQMFDGNVNYALAAYNAGPTATQKAIYKAEKNGTPDKWLSFLPAETQDYVAKISGKYSSGAGTPTRPTLQELDRALVNRIGIESPERLKLARAELKLQYEEGEKARKQREDDVVGEAFKQLDANGGRFDALSVSLRSQVPGDKLGALRDYAAKVSKGESVATDWNVYYQFRTDPQMLKNANLLAFKGVLRDEEFKSLVKEQDDLRSGKAENLTQTRSATQILNNYLLQAGVDPTPKPSTSPKSDAAKVGRALQQQAAEIHAAEIQKGGKLSQDEIEKVTAKMFARMTVKGAWFGTNEKSRFDLRPDDELVVPDTDRRQIIQALNATRQKVTEDNILNYYRLKNNLPAPLKTSSGGTEGW